MGGTVKRWMTSYGFIEADEMKNDIFVHQMKGDEPLTVGQKVKFDVKEESRESKALNVEMMER